VRALPSLRRLGQHAQPRQLNLLMPAICEAGVDILNPVGPSDGMVLADLKACYGSRMTLMGGVSKYIGQMRPAALAGPSAGGLPGWQPRRWFYRLLGRRHPSRYAPGERLPVSSTAPAVCPSVRAYPRRTLSFWSVTYMRRPLEPLRFLDRSEMNAIHAAAVQVLDETGMWVDCDEALDYLENYGCIVDRTTRGYAFRPPWWSTP